MIAESISLNSGLIVSAELVFWTCAVGLIYLYVGYPVLIWLLARWFPCTPRKRDGIEPFSVVIVVYNEAGQLRRKLDSLFDSIESSRIQEVLVASDGSTDETESVVCAYADSRVRWLSWKDRRGKPAVLNDVIPQCASEIVVLTDARQELDRRALGELVANFSDPEIGVVSGELVFRETHTRSVAAQGIGFYWRYEKFIRKSEGRYRSVPGATGALYAIRRKLFRPIHPRTLLDDVVIPMQAVVQGYRCTFEPLAIFYDNPSSSSGQESIRKRRTIAGNAQLIAHHPSWLLPWRNPIWMEFVSHKILRLCSPALLLGAGLSNLLLAHFPLYGVLLVLQIGLYVSAFVGWMLQRAGKRSSYFGPAFMFLTLNLVTVVALWDAARGRYRVTWNKAT